MQLGQNRARETGGRRGLARVPHWSIVRTMPNTQTKVTFWGVRGSTPTPDRGTWRYGGNTACVEVVTGDGTRFILDCGTGMRLLGNRWEEDAGHRPIEAHILVTHYHWDHIQGIPFFHPFFQQQNRFHFYSFESKYLGPDSLRKVLEAQIGQPLFSRGFEHAHRGPRIPRSRRRRAI